jgi:phage major head subunit gpT-like protein
MPTDVTAFTALARSEFMAGKIEAESRPFPAKYDQFVTNFPSTTRVETHTYMSSLPRLAEFKGYVPGTRFGTKEYTVANKEYRIGPISVRKTDLDDDQTGGYLLQINGLTEQGKKDIGYKVLNHLAAGTSTPCFDATNFFANSHTVGTGDNLDVFNGAANDGATYKIIALRTDNSKIKPVVFQDRESLSELMTDADTPQAMKQKEFEYWADCRFGLAYGFWWDAYHVTITDTPTVTECYDIFKQIINGFRTFKLPKGKDSDDDQYVHEGWSPDASNTVLLCSLGIEEVLSTAINLSQYVTSGGLVDNVYKGKATVIGTSSLN